MSDIKNSVSKSTHNISIKSREQMHIIGIKEIINFDENEVNLITIQGNLSIEGERLHINVLNISEEEVEIAGKINALYYSDINEGEKRSLLSKIFR